MANVKSVGNNDCVMVEVGQAAVVHSHNNTDNSSATVGALVLLPNTSVQWGLANFRTPTDSLSVESRHFRVMPNDVAAVMVC